MNIKRSSGILLHPTSLPGRHGIGSLGRHAFSFVDYLNQCRQKLWQVLPLGHTGYGDSPYQSFSIHAGNPILIDLDLLLNEGLLHENEINPEPPFPEDRVDYGRVINYIRDRLKLAHERFRHDAQHLKADYDRFVHDNQHWLHDYAMFIALKERFGGKPWWEWNDEFRLRHESAIQKFTEHSNKEISFYKFSQFLFFRQWGEVKKYANNRGISIIGDIPLYVAHDSSDVWSHHHLFQFDEERKPVKVAGVPPDYFSKTGQLWGNPLYDWNYMQQNGFRWWTGRVKSALELFDIVRIDHFRGFEAYWAVPYGDKTAINGEWVTAPGHDLFRTIQSEMGNLPIIAEDLGIITPEVEALRDGFQFPGMKILQFAFHSDEGSGYLPHNFDKNFVVYTGTHDNDTLLGWFTALEKDIKKKVLNYADASRKDVVKKIIRVAWGSVATMAVIPLQDLLELGSEARMNTPGTPSGNWQWRFRSDQLTEEKAGWLAHITQLYNR
ncbi:MAG: 4-alpha-glucanotransferase [Bacteroidales bacterium]